MVSCFFPASKWWRDLQFWIYDFFIKVPHGNIFSCLPHRVDDLDKFKSLSGAVLKMLRKKNFSGARSVFWRISLVGDDSLTNFTIEGFLSPPP